MMLTDIWLPSRTFVVILADRFEKPLGSVDDRTAGLTARENDEHTGPAETEMKAFAATSCDSKFCTFSSKRFSDGS